MPDLLYNFRSLNTKLQTNTAPRRATCPATEASRSSTFGSLFLLALSPADCQLGSTLSHAVDMVKSTKRTSTKLTFRVSVLHLVHELAAIQILWRYGA